MGLTWNWLALLGLLALAVGALAALVILFAPGPGRVNRRLALVIALDVSFVGFASGPTYLMEDPRDAYGIQVLAVMASAMVPGAYLLLLSTIDSPLARPLRGPWRERALAAATLLAGALVVARTDWFVLGVEPTEHARWDGKYGAGVDLLMALTFAVLLYALAVAFTAWRRAEGELRRRQARAYLLAFGLRDTLLAILIVVFAFATKGDDPRLFLAAILLSQSIPLVFVPILAYGVLTTRLFDIDVRIRRGVSRVTLGAVFLAVFLVVAQVAQGVLSTRLGIVAGGIAAGLLLFVLHPLQAMAERIARATVPRGDDRSDYLAYRKCEVYRAAYEGAREGGVGPSERRMLERLRASLDLPAEDADALERDVDARWEKGTPSFGPSPQHV